ncbi:MAG: hypothetical protein H6619_04770 [Deltaproteobacteria bacterium]|nr:hypothetical protein [Deltaproteobacteria bacterium]
MHAKPLKSNYSKDRNRFLELVLKICAIILSACIISCSSLGSTTSIEFPRNKIEQLEPKNLKKISKDPSIYSFTPDEDTKQPAYFTAVKDCSFTAESSKLTTTRQLFVGFDQLKLLRHQEVLQQNILLSIAQVKLDQTYFGVATYSLKEGSCVTDFIFWMQCPPEIVDQEHLPNLEKHLPAFERIVSLGIDYLEDKLQRA